MGGQPGDVRSKREMTGAAMLALLAEADRALWAAERLEASRVASALETWPEREPLPEAWLRCDASSLRPHPGLALIPGEALSEEAIRPALHELFSRSWKPLRDLLRTPLERHAESFAAGFAALLRPERLDHEKNRRVTIALAALLAQAPGSLAKGEALALMSALLEQLQRAAQLWNRELMWHSAMALMLLVRERGLPAGPLRSWAEVGFVSPEASPEQRGLCAALLLAADGERLSAERSTAIELLRGPKEHAYAVLFGERVLLDAGETEAATQLARASLADLSHFVALREGARNDALFSLFDRERVALGFVRSVHGRAGLSLARLRWGLGMGSSSVLRATLSSVRALGPEAASLAPSIVALARTHRLEWVRARAWQTLPEIVDAAHRPQITATLEHDLASDPVAWVEAERNVASDMLLSGWAPAGARR